MNAIRMCKRDCGRPALPMPERWECAYRGVRVPVGEAARTRRREYDRKRSPKAERGRHQRWREANREKERETDRKRYAADPGKISSKVAARRAMEIAVQCDCCTPKQIADFYAVAALICADVDHCSALADGGKHCLKNLQLLDPLEHRKKTGKENSIRPLIRPL